jgi:hypothetical protein
VSSEIPHQSGKLDLRTIAEVALRQFAWWLIMVLIVTFAGYPGVVCVTPMAWLVALRVGNQVAWRSKSGLRSQRLTESALAGGFFGFLQGVLFGVIVPFMGPLRPDELANSILLILFMLVVGTLAGAGLSFFTAFLNENRRKE